MLKREPFKLNFCNAAVHTHFDIKAKKKMALGGENRQHQSTVLELRVLLLLSVLMLFRQLDNVNNQFQITYNQYLNL